MSAFIEVFHQTLGVQIQQIGLNLINYQTNETKVGVLIEQNGQNYKNQWIGVLKWVLSVKQFIKHLVCITNKGSNSFIEMNWCIKKNYLFGHFIKHLMCI